MERFRKYCLIHFKISICLMYVGTCSNLLFPVVITVISESCTKSPYQNWPVLEASLRPSLRFVEIQFIVNHKILVKIQLRCMHISQIIYRNFLRWKILNYKDISLANFVVPQFSIREEYQIGKKGLEIIFSVIIGLVYNQKCIEFPVLFY